MDKRAVFYLAVDEKIDHVSALVYKTLLGLDRYTEMDIIIDGNPVITQKDQ